MKQFTLLLLLWISATHAQTIDFADENLKLTLLAASPSYAIAQDESDNFVAIDQNADGDIQLSEALVIRKLYLDNQGISNLDGLSSFSNLRFLTVANNPLNGQSLDFSALTQLQFLSCEACNASAVNVTGLSQLNILQLMQNSFSSLNLAGLINLSDLDCSNNILTSLDLSGSPGLSRLNCSANFIQDLNVQNLSALSELNVQYNQLSTLDLSGLVSLVYLTAYENDLTNIVLADAVNLQFLFAYSNQLTGLDLSASSQLKYLDVRFNMLSGIDVSASPNLYELSVDSNQIATLNLQSNAALHVLSCNNNVLTALDLSNNPSVYSLNCSNNNLASLDISTLANLGLVDCANNQISTFIVGNHPVLGTMSCSNNQISVLDLSETPYLVLLKCAQNNLTTVDFSMLHTLQDVDCSGNQFTGLDFSQNPNLYFVQYSDNPLLQNINLKNGAYQEILFSGTDFATLPALGFLCLDDFEISIYESVLAPILPNLIINSYCSLNPAGNVNKITGNVRYDFDQNGCDANDTVQSMAKVVLSDGVNSGATFTDENGNYEFYVNEGAFTVSVVLENASYFDVQQQSPTIVFDAAGSMEVNNDICVAPVNQITDLEVFLYPYSLGVPGYESFFQLVYRNKGTQPLSGNINFSFDDSKMDVLVSSPEPSATTFGSYVYNFSNLLPFESGSALVILQFNGPEIDNPVEVGDVLPFSLVGTIDQQDGNLDDNTFNYSHTVDGAALENTVLCLQGDAVEPTEIGDYLNYVINFENTGTGDAPFVALRSAVDPGSFDISSVQVINSSAPVTVKVTDDVLEFLFDSAPLQPGGQGNVMFRMKSNAALEPGDTVNFSSEVYFDYDSQVTTNTASTTFTSMPLSVDELSKTVSIYPNPTTGLVYVKAASKVNGIALFDARGRKLLDSNNTDTVDLSAFNAGVYFLNVYTDQGIGRQKLIKQ
ncbi:hypothetical protein HYN48_00460 [Flavobacterium magnum]|uniref:Uncharacterized protein n=1 Tax=Flavobacterium magnum TaxID=2162713 RepID=A0A2S0RAL4_9FLAO|nr:T9SS type A sorting domain-containing protein [Flavobacterium magnum]AWA28676.1 hypothetical protein HYN48_00460 [Flavobacterium magnum]